MPHRQAQIQMPQYEETNPMAPMAQPMVRMAAGMNQKQDHLSESQPKKGCTREATQA